MPRPTPELVVSEDQQKQIEQWLTALGTPQQVALRGRIVLAAGQGKSEAAIAAEMKVNRKTVRLWCERFVAQGLCVDEKSQIQALDRTQPAKAPLPRFNSDQEAAEYFESHSTAKIWNQLPKGELAKL